MHDIDDAELGHELAALGRVVPDVDLVDAVRADLGNQSGRSPLARVAAIVLVALGAVLAIPDVREAAADWFGIGRTAVRGVDELPSATSTTSRPAPIDAPADLGAAEDALGSAIRLPSPDLVGPIRAIEIGTDQVVVTWDDVSLTVRPITPDTPPTARIGALPMRSASRPAKGLMIVASTGLGAMAKPVFSTDQPQTRWTNSGNVTR